MLHYMCRQWDPCQFAYGSFFRPPAATQISSQFFAKASIHYQGNQKQICWHFSLSNTLTYVSLRKFCESLRKYSRKTGCPTQRSLHVFSSMSCYMLYFPNWKIPHNNQRAAKFVRIYIYIIRYLYIHRICARICKCKIIRRESSQKLNMGFVKTFFLVKRSFPDERNLDQPSDIICIFYNISM